MLDPEKHSHHHDPAHVQAHDHNHDHGPEHVHPITQNLALAFALNLCFTLIEFVGGLLTNSMAIMSDAVHDLGDTVAIGSALFLEKHAGKKRDHKFSYGYKRLSPLSALINAVILCAGSLVILIETIPRFWGEAQEVHAQGMMGLAVLGIIMNGLAVWRLRGNNDSLNQRVVMLHLLEDVFGWIAILLGAGIILLTGWYWIDPVLSVGIAVFILWNAGKNLRAVLGIFLQAIPEKINEVAIKEKLGDLSAIASVHDTHIWSLDGQAHVLTIHLVLQEELSLPQLIPLKQEVRKLLKDQHIQHVTIEFEMPGEECEMEDC